MKVGVVGKWVVAVGGGKLLVSEGEKVCRGQVIAKLKQKEEIKDTAMAGIRWKTGEKEEWLGKWKGKKVTAGEELVAAGFGRSPVKARETGVIKGIDEFGNLVYAVIGAESEIVAPVDGVIKLPEEGRVVIEFRAAKVEGEGVGADKAWGRAGDGKMIERLNDITTDLAGRIIMMPKVEETMLMKAEVVGVAGVLTRESVEEWETNLPILKLGPKDWDVLADEFGERKTFWCLINAAAGRLLVVESKGK